VSGATGATGREGAGGAQGATGAAGTNSETGPTGPAGIGGATGPTGEAGQNGATGAAGPEGAQGPTGTGGPTGETGGTGPTGVAQPPATLQPGHKEVGYFSAVAGHEPENPPYKTVGNISFPIPLPKALEESHAHYIDKSERQELERGFREEEVENPVTKEFETVKVEFHVPGCYQPKLEETDPNLLEEPKAETGNLCVYAGLETLSPLGDALLVGIANENGAAGASAQGAAVEFEGVNPQEIAIKRVKIRVQGTWAVAE
jgi:hypothetical protein